MSKKIQLLIFSAMISFLSSTAVAGGGGSGWTQCSISRMGLTYSFKSYIRSLQVGEIITVLTKVPDDKTFGLYVVDSIDLSKQVGVVELSHILKHPFYAHSADNTDFGKMKIEYLSFSALKDIRVTFEKDGIVQVDNNVKCATF